MTQPGAPVSSTAAKAARTASRRENKARRRDIAKAVRASWADDDADMMNVLEAAFEADGPSRTTSLILFGIASRAIAELADVTGTSREARLSAFLG